MATFTVEHIVGAFVAEVRQLIQQDWLRVKGNLRTLPGVGPSWLRGRQVGLTLASFKRRWCARGALASVSLGPCEFMSVHLATTAVPVGQ
jgi:hypothetical protein